MSIRFLLAKQIGKLTRFTLKTLKRNGTSLPGKVALTIDPSFFDAITKDMKVVMVSGTNGKTLTTSLITHVLKQQYKVITNESGSNMVQGIATTLLNTNKAEIAVLEVDEANIKKLTKYIKPELIVFTNLFKDQTDRFSDINETYQHMIEGVKLTPDTKLVVNGDLPLFNYDDLVNSKKYFGFNYDLLSINKFDDDLNCPRCQHKLDYHLHTYANLGNYYCNQCGFKRPELDYQITDIIQQTKNNSIFKINNSTFQLEVGGLYNIYNALAAYSVAKYFQISDQVIQQGFNDTPVKFGRQESFKLNNQEVTINLIKNPVGFNQIVDLIALDNQPKSLICLLNDNYADGQDISWINEADFEKLATLSIDEVYYGGLRYQELGQRLEKAGFKNITAFNSFDLIIENLNQMKSTSIYLLATYTALLEFRALLAKAGYIKKEME